MILHRLSSDILLSVRIELRGFARRLLVLFHSELISLPFHYKLNSLLHNNSLIFIGHLHVLIVPVWEQFINDICVHLDGLLLALVRHLEFGWVVLFFLEVGFINRKCNVHMIGLRSFSDHIRINYRWRRFISEWLLELNGVAFVHSELFQV